MGTASAWTAERKAKQAELLRRTQPWAKSTGPRTPEGKAISSRNADKGGQRERHRAQMRLRREMSRALLEIVALIRAAHTGNMLDWGECIDPDYDRSEAFLAARARHDRARTEYWRLVLRADDPDFRVPMEDDNFALPELATFMVAGMDIASYEEEE